MIPFNPQHPEGVKKKEDSHLTKGRAFLPFFHNLGLAMRPLHGGKERSEKVKHPNHSAVRSSMHPTVPGRPSYVLSATSFNTNSVNKPSKVKASGATEKQEGNKSNKFGRKEKHANPKGTNTLTFPQTVIRGQAHC